MPDLKCPRCGTSRPTPEVERGDDGFSLYVCDSCAYRAVARLDAVTPPRPVTLDEASAVVGWFLSGHDNEMTPVDVGPDGPEVVNPRQEVIRMIRDELGIDLTGIAAGLIALAEEWPARHIATPTGDTDG